MPETIRHALTGWTYTREDDGTVTVRDPRSGREGRYDAEGRHVGGELDYVDHHMLGHMLGARARSAGMRGRSPGADRADRADRADQADQTDRADRADQKEPS